MRMSISPCLTYTQFVYDSSFIPRSLHTNSCVGLTPSMIVPFIRNIEFFVLPLVNSREIKQIFPFCSNSNRILLFFAPFRIISSILNSLESAEVPKIPIKHDSSRLVLPLPFTPETTDTPSLNKISRFL